MKKSTKVILGIILISISILLISYALYYACNWDVENIRYKDILIVVGGFFGFVVSCAFGGVFLSTIEEEK